MSVGERQDFRDVKCFKRLSVSLQTHITSYLEILRVRAQRNFGLQETL